MAISDSTYRHPSSPRTCINCAAYFMAPNYRIASGGGIFCTKRCALLHRQANGEMLPTLGCRESHPNWKGGRINHNGYVKVIIDNGGVFPYRREHLVIAEKVLNRPLSKNEVIHHIDENTKNNSLDNLALMKNADHSALHAKIRRLRRELTGHDLASKIAELQPASLALPSSVNQYMKTQSLYPMVIR